MEILDNLLKLYEKADSDKKFKVCKQIQSIALNVLFEHYRTKFHCFDSIEELKLEIEILEEKIEGRLTTGFDQDGSQRNSGYNYSKEEHITNKSDIEDSIRKNIKRKTKKISKYASEVGFNFLFPTEKIQNRPKILQCESCLEFFVENSKIKCNCVQK